MLILNKLKIIFSIIIIAYIVFIYKELLEVYIILSSNSLLKK